jgi:hypothetical protein
MPFKRHPSHAVLLSVLNHTAPADEQKLVMAHLTNCIRCRKVANRYEVTLRELNALGAGPLLTVGLDSTVPGVFWENPKTHPAGSKWLAILEGKLQRKLHQSRRIAQSCD